MFSLIGWITSKALGWAMPSLGPNTFMAIAALLVVGFLSMLAFHQGAEGKAAAIATEQAACEIDKADDRRAAAESLAHLMGTINALPDEPEGLTRAEACKRDPFCKAGGKK